MSTFNAMQVLSHQVTGSGPLLLLLHPIGLDSHCWGGLPARLAQRCRVVAVDTAGHGRSPDAARPGAMQDRVADVLRLLADLGRGPAVLLGVSFGGMIAQQVALAQPDRVAALVLGGCPGAIPAAAREAILKRGTDAEAGGMAAVVDATLARWFTPGFLSTEEVGTVRARLLADDPSNWAAGWEAIAEHDALAGLARLDLPALVVAGESDEATPLAAKQALAAAIPGSRLSVLPGAPHMMQIECPGAFADTVLSFLDTVPAAARP